MNVVLAIDDGDAVAHALAREGVSVVAIVAPTALAAAAQDVAWGSDSETVLRAVMDAEAVLLDVSKDSVTAQVVAMCDRASVRVVPRCGDAAAERIASLFGLEHPIAANVEPWVLADRLRTAPVAMREPVASAPRVITVWGASGAPGRSTVAIELAVELSRGDRHVALIDADSHSPSLALSLGLADEGPGFAAACRQFDAGTLDARELTRISLRLPGTNVEVLTGLNRPSRWPELTHRRVTGALAQCRAWADYTVVDVAASLERDEEIISDVDGLRRNDATLAAVHSADLVVAVVGADPVGVARFVRGYAELRSEIGSTPVLVLANRLRAGSLGIDARGQVRRTLDRFAGITDVSFLPQDPRSADAALLASRPIADIAPRSPFTLALRRFVGEHVVGAPVLEPARGRRGTRRRASAMA
ncbi:P-loop NTPase [Microbacterium sp. C7(2022)]|uniref:AAA family ATPase n=1 Tax=Microbacterium sp. C7(2022) TaxID=2992759 RepID=UPI00237C092C|nr:P-loop NTPase [Microbacterium sp. C7(2022)]MDE0547285.1 P-loop NTPase [Microbacterium sp. C7(2022)]